MLAVLYTRQSYLNPTPQYPRRSSKKSFDFSNVISRFKASHSHLSGNCSPDMPKKDETPPPKPRKKSSSTRANSDLVVRQVSGTHSNGPSSSPTVDSGGGSEAQSASQRSSPSPISSSRKSNLADRPARTTDSGTGRNRTSPVPAAYIDNYLAYRKKAFIKVFMEKVCEWLDDNVCPGEEAYEHDGDSQPGSKSSGSGGIKIRAVEGRPVAGQKRQLKGRDQDDEGSENDESNDQNRNKKRTKTDEDDNRQKFACPFYKHDPVRYKSHRTCVGPGWHEIHRMKEHIYRKHKLFACTRCFEAFKSDKLLLDHQRADVACPVRDKKTHKPDPGAGIDQETEKHLRARTVSKKDDVGKWYEVYYILFPGMQDVDNAPSPWYDDTAGDSDSQGLKRQYVKFLRREMPNMIQRELESELNRHFEGFEDGIMDRLVTWIRTSSAKCANIFENIPSPSQAAALGDPENVRSRSRAASPADPETDLTVGVGAGVEPWGYGYPDFDWRGSPSFDQYNNPFSFLSSDDQCLTDFDSAYVTGSIEDSSGARQNYIHFTCGGVVRIGQAVIVKDGISSWRYRYFGDFSNLAISTKPPSGAYLGAELQPLFGTFPQTPPGTSDELAIVEFLRGAWTTLAKYTSSGSLSYTGGWPVYDPAQLIVTQTARDNQRGSNLDSFNIK
ncbi:hypothetical protein CORC01_07636 [Colletotrichum orchidophilum]|uniref:C2H2-type domain-containing protein n=1 Tax=Colletotrichum orchidophilum TaxID=1209926 RepID=A0A1G4B6K4_9PEZI|nr:uncharacterized protein CORC01_07636 [Colletotrichum orchidophilum]OHE97027.1 hypothetical protein CORC01_07636 [Colletotrichum orchidophilum]